MLLLITHPTLVLSSELQQSFENLGAQLNKPIKLLADNEDTISTICSTESVDILFLLLPNKSRIIQKYLNDCRELRIPYIFLNETQAPILLSSIFVSVGFLEEEIEKAQYVTYFSRFCESSIHILCANDVGSRAKKNAAKFCTAFDKFGLRYEMSIAQKNSFKVELEAVKKANLEQVGLLVILASRDYGLDDIFFGPKERHVIMKANLPVMLVNPRADLYSLCD